MRLRGSNHSVSAKARAFTVVVMAAAMFAQLLSLSHEMTVRHFRCAEHGELTHLPTLDARLAAVDAPAARAAGSATALRSGGAEATDAHEHCGVAFTVEGSACTASSGSADKVALVPPAPRPVPAALARRGRAFVLASAPKTSPPTA
jgi:hypothetical protein